MGPGRRITRRCAFTLIEVLVSLGIFALAAVVLGAAYVNVLLNYHLLQRPEVDRSGMAIARAELLLEPDRAQAERGGEMPLPDGGMLRWETTMEETPVADLFEVELAWEVAMIGRPRPHLERERLLLLRPTWSTEEQREKLRAASRVRLQKHRS